MVLGIRCMQSELAMIQFWHTAKLLRGPSLRSHSCSGLSKICIVADRWLNSGIPHYALPACVQMEEWRRKTSLSFVLSLMRTRVHFKYSFKTHSMRILRVLIIVGALSRRFSMGWLVVARTKKLRQSEFNSSKSSSMYVTPHVINTRMSDDHETTYVHCSLLCEPR